MLERFWNAVGKAALVLPLVLHCMASLHAAEQAAETKATPEPIAFTFDPFSELAVSPLACLFPLVRLEQDKPSFDVFLFGDYIPALGAGEAGAPRMRFAFRIPGVQGKKARGAVGVHWLKDEKLGACQLKGPVPAGDDCLRTIAEAGCMVEIIDVDEDRWPGLERFLWQLTEIPLKAEPKIAVHGEDAMIVIASPVDDPLIFFSATPQGALRKWLVKLHRWALAHSARKGPLEAPINLHVVVP
jgi:hypothetical protein